MKIHWIPTSFHLPAHDLIFISNKHATVQGLARHPKCLINLQNWSRLSKGTRESDEMKDHRASRRSKEAADILLLHRRNINSTHLRPNWHDENSIRDDYAASQISQRLNLKKAAK